MSALPQFNDLNSRVSAIESFLNHLEEKVTSTYEQEELVSHTHTHSHTPRERTINLNCIPLESRQNSGPLITERLRLRGVQFGLSLIY